MDKATLKSAWGHYCDTDKLVNDTMALLTKYKHRNTEHGVCAMLDEYFNNKHALIDMFMKSPNYIEDMRVVFDIELERYSNKDDISNFVYYFMRCESVKNSILKYVDKDGKKLDDYTKVGVTSFKATDLLNEDFIKSFSKNTEKKKRFLSDGRTVDSNQELCAFNNLLSQFSRVYGSTMAQETIDKIKTYNDKIKLAAGMKTSRAFNRVCAYYGVDKCADYNKLFAQYSDMVSGLKRKLKFYMSLNPLDYLTMSFGVNWASCHTIDKTNQRRMTNGYHGQYCGGTTAYMLDSTSIITYVHNKMTTDVEEGKIYRCMFHYGNGTLVQGRIYPQGNDGSTDLYKVFRGFVQKEITDMLGVDSTWVKSSSRASRYVNTHGVNYPDYQYTDDCNVSYIKEIRPDGPNTMIVGHVRVCPYCGREISNDYNEGMVAHSSC